ncbi:MAG: glycine cleavage system aminomethyltransferase GcvT [Tissierellia bacterium]|nr:glycine cleavage system aminomethyltransferase GcvT [Tissierellia bacterium]
MEGKKTPIYERHVALGGKVVNYAGWLLPVQYEGLIPEHEAVRNKAGLFDVSHMGEILVEGPDATAFVEKIFTNRVENAAVGRIVYGLMLKEDGFPVDDLLVYKRGEDSYLLVVNAANKDKDVDWLNAVYNGENLTIEDVSDDVGQLAVQGPKAESIVQMLTDVDLSEIKPFRFMEDVKIAGVNTLISRTGYTGEDGFELYVDAVDAPILWDELLSADEDLVPAGLGCRDTLRFEASLPLYGHEISETVDPLEGDLGFFVKLDKPVEFIGREALKNKPRSRALYGLELKGRGMLREGYEVLKDDAVIGYITTGYLSPILGKNIANALLAKDSVSVGEEVMVQIRKSAVPAVIIDRKYLKGGKK